MAGELTEGTTASHSAGKRSFAFAPWSGIIRRHVERVKAQWSHFEDFASVVNFVAKDFGMLQLFLPIGPGGIGVGPKRVLTTELALTNEGYCKWPYRPRVRWSFRRTVIFIFVGCAEQSFSAACTRSVGEVAQIQKFQRDGLGV